MNTKENKSRKVEYGGDVAVSPDKQFSVLMGTHRSENCFGFLVVAKRRRLDNILYVKDGSLTESERYGEGLSISYVTEFQPCLETHNNYMKPETIKSWVK